MTIIDEIKDSLPTESVIANLSNTYSERLNVADSKISEITESLLSPEDRVVEELNKTHAVVHTNQTYFLTEKPHSSCNGIDFTLESKQSLKDLYENKLVQCSDKKYRSKAEIWIKSPSRREYKGITFDPTEQSQKTGYYNIWRGFAVEAKKGSCKLFKEHVRTVICCGNEAYFQYVWKWLAMLIQKPNLIPEVAILLMGLQGTGKGVFVKTIGKLLGQHFLHLDSTDRLVGNFNSHMKHAVLVFADESIWGGNKSSVGRLKAMISEETTTIEQKGKDVISMRNYRHFIFASNEDWPVMLDPDDRRFLVLKVSPKHKEDYSYFENINYELSNGGYEALLHELQSEDISEFNPRKLPSNSEAFEVKIYGAKSPEKYCYYTLKAGCFDIGNNTSHGIWHREISPTTVYADYQSWCMKQGLKAENDAMLGKAIKRFIPSSDKTRPRIEGDRTHRYHFPDLEKARADFQREFKAGSEIWEA